MVLKNHFNPFEISFYGVSITILSSLKNTIKGLQQEIWLAKKLNVNISLPKSMFLAG